MAGKRPKHPGSILKEEFLLPRKLNPNRLSKLTGIPQTRLSDMIHGKRRITADNALRLSKFFGNTPRYWLNIQNDYDLVTMERDIRDDLKKIERWKKPRKK